MRMILFAIPLLITGCASEVRQSDNGAIFIKAGGAGYPLAHSAFTSRANEACPNGYEVLDEQTAWGWVITVSGHVRCREG